MKKIIKDTLALCLITLIAGLLLGFVYKITKEPIAKQNEKAKLNAYKNVFEQLDSTENISEELLSDAQNAVDADKLNCVTVNEIVKAYDSDKNYLGLIITVTDSCGYGGNIKMTVGIDKDSVITGLEFLEINETAGLGMKAKDAAFKNKFIGMKTDKVICVKGGASAQGEYDAISSATITSNAVGDGINGALISYKTVGGDKDE